MNFKIKPIAPFDFELSTKILLNDNEIAKFENNKFKHLITLKNTTILLEIESIGTVHKSELSLTLQSDTNISDENAQLAVNTVKKMFNQDFDLKPFYNDIKQDNILSKLIPQLIGLKSPVTGSVFESLISTIIEQQISLIVAKNSERKMIKRFGSTLEREGHDYYAYPTPKQLNNVSIAQLKECGLTLRKTEYIKSIAESIETGNLDLEKFGDYENNQKIIDELCKIRGIGLWTAEFVLIRGFSRLDAFPADDIGIRRIISHFYCDNKKISSTEAREIAKKWRKWKGLASYYLVMAEILDISV
ncbi:MAG: DNA-3-methyladenine glycosylase [Methanobacteriaceae archaeon]|nr:DNA-3-methyladenine glycosylase [Methanobacteriaceae archaeon]